MTETKKTEDIIQIRPWEPITEDYLTAREFASLIGIASKKDIKNLFDELIITQMNPDIPVWGPEITECFRHGIVRVLFYQGKGATKIEYRVCIDDLKDNYVNQARIVVLTRNIGNGPIINKQILKRLVYLCNRAQKDILCVMNHCLTESFSSMPLMEKIRLLSYSRDSKAPNILTQYLKQPGLKLPEHKNSVSALDIT